MSQVCEEIFYLLLKYIEIVTCKFFFTEGTYLCSQYRNLLTFIYSDPDGEQCELHYQYKICFSHNYYDHIVIAWLTRKFPFDN